MGLRSFAIFGPEKATIAEAVNRYNRVFHPDAKEAKPTLYWLAYLISIFAGSGLRYAIRIFRYFETHPEEGDPHETYTLLGNPTTDIDTFINNLKS